MEHLTITEWGQYLGWGAMDLAREAGLSVETGYKAFRGEPLSNRVKRDICSALSRATGADIKVGEVIWSKKEE